MFRQLLIGTVASACNITIHALIMVMLVQITQKTRTMSASRPSLRLIAVMITTVSILMASHASEVIVWSLVYDRLDAAPAGTYLIYFAFVNYTTLGYGDVLPVARWRLLGPLTAMNGVLLFGWPTAVISDVMRRTMHRNFEDELRLRRLGLNRAYLLRISLLAPAQITGHILQLAGHLIQINDSVSRARHLSPLRAGTDPRRLDMTDEIQSGLISRRTAFSLIITALGVALPATILAVSEAQAQTPGMERREDRREDRQERREDRRDDRQDRRDDRQEGREERRDERRGVGDQPATTGSAPTTAPK